MTVAGQERQRIQLQVQTIAGVDNYADINYVLNAHDQGQFNLSAQLVDAMMRDDRISGVTGARLGSLLASPVEFKPANSSSQAADACRVLQGDGEDEAGLWDRICPPPVMRGLSKWGFLLGFALARIIVTGTKDAWLPRLQLWHPQFVFWDGAEMRYKVIAREGVFPLPRIDEDPEGDGEWFVWAPYGYQYGWLDGLVRSLADKYLMRRWTYRDWARFNERHGQPIIGMHVPTDLGDAETKRKLMRDIAGIGSEAVVELPSVDNENKTEMEMIEPKARSFDSFDLFKKTLDVDIAVNINGQNLTTEGGTDGGSYALGNVQNQVRGDIRAWDARLAGAVREQVLRPWARANFGNPDLAPRVNYQVEPPEDEAKEALGWKTTGEAITALKTAKAPIDVRLMLDRQGVPMLSEEEFAAQQAVEAEEAAERARAAGLPPGGGVPGAGAEEDDEEGEDETETADEKEPAESLSGISQRVPLPGARKRYQFAGLPIAIENPAGSLRVWTDAGPNGKVIGSTKMLFDYGFIEGHLSGDKEELDCYIGPDAESQHVYVVHQGKAPDFKKHDEDKVFLGFGSADAARAAYVGHRNDGDRAIRGMSSIPLDIFKSRLKRRSGTGKIRATALVSETEREQLRANTVKALMALANSSGTSSVALRADRRPDYQDRVAAKGRELAARALAVDLAWLQEDIESLAPGPDWPERLKKRLVERHPEMKPDAMAEVVFRVRMLAHMNGRKTGREAAGLSTRRPRG